MYVDWMGNSSSGLPEDNQEISSKKGGGKKKGNGKRKNTEKVDPKSAKKAKLETAKYVYDKLFVEGQDSDISISALGYRWKLHRFYLKQCDYFSVLLNGEWADSKTNEYTLEIPDENITKDGIHSVLGALYNNEIIFEVDKLRSITATAAFFQMTSIFNKAGEAMITSIDDSTVLEFLECGFKYGIDKVTAKSFEYIRWNFWRLSKGVPFLRALPKEALVRLLACHDLPVIEGEIDLYRAIRGWIFLQESDNYAGDDFKELEKAASKYLKLLKYAWDNDCDSLVSTSSDEPPSELSAASSLDEIHEAFHSTVIRQPYSLFMKYSQMFAGLRLHSLCCTKTQINTIHGDIRRQSMDDISEESFLLSCTRFGRSLDELPKCWRWTGSHFGVDLLMNIQSSIMTMKRNVFTQQQQLPTYSLNVRSKVTLSYRAIILSENGTIIKDTKRINSTLEKDSLVIISRFAPGELPPKFSVHLYVMFGSPAPNPSFVLVRNAVNQMKYLSKPILEMDNVTVIDQEEERDEEEEEEDEDEEDDDNDTEKSKESDESEE
ncbi:gcl-1 [Pristionchus pacificus]|uniref:Gcl-1 n=1 Tax=Pristionchus pacificus TaxID=54126 RepID=A0A2A6BDW3_PRIPA|nr:gcl-1 [Pristionchus pacificus]|eukprot:PDM64069.1 gcl-1 [Pristionchus pacificus]